MVSFVHWTVYHVLKVIVIKNQIVGKTHNESIKLLNQLIKYLLHSQKTKVICYFTKVTQRYSVMSITDTILINVDFLQRRSSCWFLIRLKLDALIHGFLPEKQICYKSVIYLMCKHIQNKTTMLPMQEKKENDEEEEDVG